MEYEERSKCRLIWSSSDMGSVMNFTLYQVGDNLGPCKRCSQRSRVNSRISYFESRRPTTDNRNKLKKKVKLIIMFTRF